MSTALMWLLDGIARCPRERSASRGSDARQPRGARRQPVLRLAGPQHARTEICRARPRRAAPAWCCGNPSAEVAPPRLPAGVFAAAVPDLERRWWAASPTDSSTGPPRSCASRRSPAPTARPPAPTCWRNAWSSLGSQAAYIGTIGWGRIAALEPARAHHARCGHRAPRARAAARLRRARGGDGSVLARARSGPRRRRALALGGVHQFDAAITSTITRPWPPTAPPRRACSMPRTCSTSCSTSAMTSAAAWRRATTARVPLTAVWIGAGGSGWLADRALYAARSHVGFARHVDAARRQLRQGSTSPPAAGPLQRGERLDRHGLPAWPGRFARRCRASARRMRAAAGTHGSGRARRPRQTGGRRRLRAHARCAGQALRALREHCTRRAVVRVRLRRRSRLRQTPDHGRRRG